jgi:hypothetical protein
MGQPSPCCAPSGEDFTFFLKKKREEIRVSEFHFFTNLKMLLRDFVFIKSKCTPVYARKAYRWKYGVYTLRPFALPPERT